jgi:succinate dehydrogenase/fumarate reductase-like Fe-S protein
MPLPVFKLIGDLSVDTGTWFRDMHEKVESWVHTSKSLTRKRKRRGWTMLLPRRSMSWSAV